MVATWRNRTVQALAGPPVTRRLALTHAIDDFADSILNLSLVGSLLFNVSLDASRTRILLYLVLTAAPLAIVAPAVGPLLDRTRAGYRATMIATHLARVALSLALAGALLSLTFYPLVFGVLLARKAYALVKTTMLAQLAPDRHDLVRASGHLARTGTVAGGFGTAVGGVIIVGVGVQWLPVVAAVGFAAAAISAHTMSPAGATIGPRTPPGPATVPADVRDATLAVSTIHAAAGALTFLLAFAIKRGGSDEWVFVAALVAAGAGTFAGTVVAPRLHHRMASDRIVLLCLLGPGLVTLGGVLAVGSTGVIAIAFAIGLGGSIASRVMDGLYGRVPEARRGRVISRTELRFQLANVAGAALAVLLTPGPRVGFGVAGLVLIAGGAAYASDRRLSIRQEAGHLLLERRPVNSGATGQVAELLDEAQRAVDRGRFSAAIALADAAVALHCRTSIVVTAVEPTAEEAASTIAEARRVIAEPDD